MHARLSGLLWLAVALAVACGPAASQSPATGSVAGSAPAAGGASTAVESATADVPLQKVRAGYSSLSGGQLPLYMAAEQGFFARNGLDVELSYIASGSVTMQSMIAGEVNYIVSTGVEAAAAYVGGAPARIVLGLINTVPLMLMVDPSITTPADLRGKVLTTTRFGTQAHVGARLALKHWGLNPDTDVSFLQFGTTQDMLLGMQQGAAVGGALSPPTNVRARQLGYRVLSDMTQLGLPYQSTSLLSLQPYLEANPDVTYRFVRSMLQAIHLYHTDEATTRAALAQFARTDDAEVLEDTIRIYRGVLERVPYPEAAAIQTVLDDLADRAPRAREVAPAELVDTSALERLEREGFVRQLYGS